MLSRDPINIDGGELNFLSVISHVFLVNKRLDQITAIGETAKQVEAAIRETNSSKRVSTNIHRVSS